ncbi:MAG: ABC transporter permease [Clostridium sp.]|nr:ABC transporter permease [Clostridium sp.]
MKMNPVYKRELKVGSRSIRMAVILLAFNGILSAVALFNMYSAVEQVKMTAEIQYSRFLQLYVFVASLEFIMLMFIMPALTSNSISGERERQTLDLMLTTTMKPGKIVLGKLAAAFTTMLLLVLSSFPVLSLVFVYGGITVTDMAQLMLCYVTVALLSGAVGVFFSSMFKRSTLANVCAYVTIIFLVAGTYGANIFAYQMSQNEISSYMDAVDNITRQASSGGSIYMLLFNPAVTFYAMINQQAGDSDVAGTLERMFGAHPQNFVLKHWTEISIAVQILAAVLLIAAAVAAVTPVWERGRERRRGKDKNSRPI